LARQAFSLQSLKCTHFEEAALRIEKYMDVTPDRGNPATDATDQVKVPEDLSTDEVRQGVTGNGVRYVLGISLVAALVCLGLAWVYVV
jgi:hypothetical protein